MKATARRAEETGPTPVDPIIPETIQNSNVIERNYMIPVLCQIRQAAKSPAFHAGNVGSIPASGAYPTKGKRD